MFENISEKQEKVQEKVQKQQELNDDKSRELTDEELDQIVGGATKAQLHWGTVVAQDMPGATGAQAAVADAKDALVVAVQLALK